MMSKLAYPTMAVVCALAWLGCTVQTPNEPDSRPSFLSEDCWPPSPTCTERGLTGEEAERLDSLFRRHMKDDAGECAGVRALALSDVANGSFRVQTSAPYVYNQSGDRHNEPGVTHIVSAYLIEGDDEDIVKMAIHESRHGTGGDDGAAYGAESSCFNP